MERKDSGFTIVELVVVIILLGILAATALPRFINIDDNAYDAAFSAAQGGLQTGIAMFHGEYMAQKQPAADTPFGDFSGLRNNASGYPYGTADNSGSGSDVVDENDCAAVFSNVMQSGAPSVSGVANVAALVGLTTDFGAVFSAGPVCTYYHTAHGTDTGDTVGTLQYDPATGALVAGTYTF